MSYDRSAFERRANLHYESAEEDAAYIAGEVIRKGRSVGWLNEEEEKPVAAAIEKILAQYNIGLINPSAGVWGWRQGGTKFFSR